MMRLRTRIYYIGCILFMGILLFAGCSSKRRQAEEAMQRGQWQRAASLYAELYREIPTRRTERRGDYAWRAAESYRQLRMYPRALNHYRQAERYAHADTLMNLRIGQMLHATGAWADALTYYERYLTLDPANHYALRGVEGCHLALADTAREERYVVHRAEQLSSGSSDYGASYSGDGGRLFFTTHRNRLTGDRSDITGEYDANIYSLVRSASGLWQARPDTLRGDVTTQHDEGIPCVTTDGGTLYYTYAEQSLEEHRTAQIYKATSSGEGGWGRGQLVDLWRDSLTMAAHPALSASGQTLYFVSDVLGGYGGKDLYRVSISESTIGTPQNLGNSINTPGDELYPTAVGDSTLYFSSDGHVGYGGLDLYRATLLPSGRWQVSHLPKPINSPADDHSIALDPKPNLGVDPGAGRNLLRGLIASTRDDARGRPHLYELTLPAISTVIEGYVMDRDEYAIAGATIRLIGNVGEAREQIATSRSDGSYRIEVDGDVEYVMLASAPGYLNQYARLRTDSAVRNEVYGVDFYLASRTLVEELRHIYYDFDSAVLRSESYPALEELVAILSDNPDISIELQSHADRHGSAEYNLSLSERRASSVVAYLIERGISPSRVVPRGYGQSRPAVVSERQAEQYTFLSVGQELTVEFVGQLLPEEQDVCDALNRRTEFVVRHTE